MNPKFLVLALVAAVVISGGRANAHHSFAATYFEDKSQTIEGELVQFLFRNPHSMVHVEAKDANGQVIRWVIEWAAGAQLARSGVTRETLRPGDHVIVTGSPARVAEDHRVRMKTITRPWDGWKWGGTFD
jgi:hypothetical protein